MEKYRTQAARLLTKAFAPWPVPMHAVAVLLAAGLALATASTAPLVIGATASFALLVADSRGRWGPSGQFGNANLITASRLLLILATLAVAPRLSVLPLAIVLAVAFAIDALDGYVARRQSRVSDFGAAFDQEADAFFVLASTYLLWSRAGAPAWVLIPGLLRYLYVLCLVLVTPAGPDRKRTSWARAAFVASSSALLAAFAVDGPMQTVLAAAGTVVSCASFVRSFATAYCWRPRWAAVKRFVWFVMACTALNLVANVRYPAPEPAGWYLLPSVDVVCVLLAVAALGLVGRRLPLAIRIAVVAALLLVRGLRLGDGITTRYFGHDFHPSIDLLLLPELIRFACDTLPDWELVLLAAAVPTLLALLIGGTYKAFAYAADYLARPKGAAVLAVLLLPFVVVSPFAKTDPRYDDRSRGAFAASSFELVGREATFFVNAYSRRAKVAQGIADVQRTLRESPSGLERLRGADIYLFLIESYGGTVLDGPYAARARSLLRDMGDELARRGFSTASHRLDSPTYGGMSWLAHATLMTGVRTTNQVEFDLVALSRPRTLAHIVQEAGYRTVLAAPNTTRATGSTDRAMTQGHSSERSSLAVGRAGYSSDFYGFDKSLTLRDFGYTGPSFAWATMPDQYVLDFVRRTVVDVESSPVFVTYVLVSSHAPWSRIPTVVSDWSRIGDGSLYGEHPLQRFDVAWPHYANATEAYWTSIRYDLDVLRSYLAEFVRDDALVIILGDHQPVSELTAGSRSHHVPIHVLSREHQLVEPFLARGYSAGMVPGGRADPMERFMFDLLADFSGGAS